MKDQRVRLRSTQSSCTQSSATLNSLAATVESVSYLGTAVQYVCRAGERSVVALVGNDGRQSLLSAEARVWIEWDPDDAVLLPP